MILTVVTDLDAERSRVDRALARTAQGWDAWPAVAATAPWAPRDQVAALVLLLSMPEHHVDTGEGAGGVFLDPADAVIDRLGRRVLPWDAATVRLGLEVVAAREFDERRVDVVLRAAEQVAAAGGADARLVDALGRCADWLASVHRSLSPSAPQSVPQREGLSAARRAVARALAAATPPELPAPVAGGALLCHHVGPTLRAAGFTGPGPTWRRPHPERVDVVHLDAAGEDVSLTYGVWFDAAHPADRPFSVERDRVRSHHLDVRLREHWATDPASLDRCSAHLRTQVVPFLDAFAVYELARDHLLTGAGAPAGAQALGAPGCPDHRAVLGLLALQVGDRETALEQLALRVEESAVRAVELAFWRGRLEEAGALPSG